MPTLNDKVQPQRRAPGTNGVGQALDTWIDVGLPLWAKVEYLRGREWFAAAQEQATADARVTVRFTTAITADMRLVHRGQPLDIQGVPIPIRDDSRRQFLEMMCVAGVKDGR